MKGTVSFKLSILGLSLALLSIYSSRTEIFDFRVNLLLLVIGVIFSVVAAITGILSLVTSNSYKTALPGIIIGIAIAGPISGMVALAFKLPRIHDISTDVQDVPQFMSVLFVRSPNDNNLTVSSDVIAAQLEAYPDIKPFVSAFEYSCVFNTALALVKLNNWTVVAEDEKLGVIEATDRTLVMQYKDDVIVRVRSKDNLVVLDMRSASRVGQSDFGKNADRIRSFLKDLEEMLNSKDK